MKLSKRIQITSIKRKTKAKVLQDILIGDTIEVYVNLGRVGASRGRSYAPVIGLKLERTDEVTGKTFNEFGIFEDIFDYVEL